MLLALAATLLPGPAHAGRWPFRECTKDLPASCHCQGHDCGVQAVCDWNGTTVFDAAHAEDTDALKHLLEVGSEVQPDVKCKCTPLHVAAEDGHLKVAELLLLKRANVRAKNESDVVPLHLAAQHGYLELTDVLLAHNASVHDFDKNHVSALHLAAREGHSRTVEALLGYRAKVSAVSKSCTPLHLGAREGHLDVVDVLIKHNAPIQAEGWDDKLPLHWASKEGHKEVVERLLANGSNVNSGDHIKNATSLHYAAARGHVRTTKCLLEHSADVNALDGNGRPPLIWASQAENNKFYVVQLLTKYRANTNIQSGPEKLAALHYASADCSMSVCQTLLHHTANVGSRDGNHSTPMHHAAKNNCSEVVKLLLQHRADPDSENKEHSMPLHLAAIQGHLSTTNLLLERGSRRENSKQYTPLHFAAQRGHPQLAYELLVTNAAVDAPNHFNSTPLHLAACHGPLHLSVVKVLVNHSAFVDARDRNDRVPLHFAAMHHQLEITQVLLDSKADINARDKQWRTPLHHAVRSDSFLVASMLLTRRADLEAVDESKQTALHVAVEQSKTTRDLDIVKLLLKHGANVNAPGRNRSTPLLVASSCKDCCEIIRELLRAGADVNDRDENNMSSLHLLADSSLDDYKCARVLFDHDAEVDARDRNNVTPLHLAARRNSSSVARALMDEGADCNATDKSDNTSLHHAASNGHITVANELLNRRAYLEAKDRNLGDTPLARAAESRNIDVIDLLLNYGANPLVFNKEFVTPVDMVLRLDNHAGSKLSNAFRNYGVPPTTFWECLAAIRKYNMDSFYLSFWLGTGGGIAISVIFVLVRKQVEQVDRKPPSNNFGERDDQVSPLLSSQSQHPLANSSPTADVLDAPDEQSGNLSTQPVPPSGLTLSSVPGDTEPGFQHLETAFFAGGVLVVIFGVLALLICACMLKGYYYVDCSNAGVCRGEAAHGGHGWCCADTDSTDTNSTCKGALERQRTLVGVRFEASRTYNAESCQNECNRLQECTFATVLRDRCLLFPEEACQKWYVDGDETGTTSMKEAQVMVCYIFRIGLLMVIPGVMWMCWLCYCVFTMKAVAKDKLLEFIVAGVIYGVGVMLQIGSVVAKPVVPEAYFYPLFLIGLLFVLVGAIAPSSYAFYFEFPLFVADKWYSDSKGHSFLITRHDQDTLLVWDDTMGERRKAKLSYFTLKIDAPDPDICKWITINNSLEVIGSGFPETGPAIMFEKCKHIFSSWENLLRDVVPESCDAAHRHDLFLSVCDEWGHKFQGRTPCIKIARRPNRPSNWCPGVLSRVTKSWHGDHHWGVGVGQSEHDAQCAARLALAVSVARGSTGPTLMKSLCQKYPDLRRFFQTALTGSGIVQQNGNIVFDNGDEWTVTKARPKRNLQVEREGEISWRLLVTRATANAEFEEDLNTALELNEAKDILAVTPQQGYFGTLREPLLQHVEKLKAAKSQSKSNSADADSPERAIVMRKLMKPEGDKWWVFKMYATRFSIMCSLLASVAFCTGPLSHKFRPWLVLLWFMLVWVFPACLEYGPRVFVEPVRVAVPRSFPRQLYVSVVVMISAIAWATQSPGSFWWSHTNYSRGGLLGQSDKAQQWWRIDDEGDVVGWVGETAAIRGSLHWDVDCFAFYHGYEHCLWWVVLLASPAVFTINCLMPEPPCSKSEVSYGVDIVKEVKTVEQLRALGYEPSSLAGLCQDLIKNTIFRFYGDVSLLVNLLSAGHKWFASVGIAITVSSVIVAALLKVPCKLQADLRKVQTKGVLGDSMHAWYRYLHGFEAFIQLAFASYSMPFVGRYSAQGLMSATLSIAGAVFSLSGQGFDVVFLTPDSLSDGVAVAPVSVESTRNQDE